ncbi:MAG TPA: cobalamin-dependent protein [Acetivibrio sp.]|nr:cobalamin-dependent protein [Acetivibrio sp.]
MRVLLIKPETIGIFAYTNLVDHEPLELEYLYTILKNRGHDAYIYDRRHDMTPLRRKLKTFTPDVVCITGYITQEKLMIKLARLIKRFNSNITVIIGGSHAELNYKNFIDSPVDYIYHLSGLDSFIKLIDFIDNTSSTPLDDIPGICYRKGHGWNINKKVVETPEDLPPIDRTYFYRNRNRYRYLTFHPLALVKNSYSCNSSCTFCYCTNRNSGQYACRKAEDLVNEIMATDAPNIHITDDNFLVDREYLKQFVELIREKKINKKYLVYGRADFIAENKDIMCELKDIGLSLVMVGLEARSNQELDSYNKNATLEHNEECVRTLEELGIICAGLFIVHQDMTVKDFKELYNWIDQRAIIPTISIFTPMQGSADFSKYKDNLLSTDSRKQDLFHCILKPKQMSTFRFYYEYYKLSIKLAWNRRKAPLYSCINIGSFFFIIKVLLMKLRRVFII